MSDRIVRAAKALADAEAARRAAVDAIDWSRCERGYEDGRAVCTLEADMFTAPENDPLATYLRCAECDHNRSLFGDIRAAKIRRANAVRRVVRAVAAASRAAVGSLTEDAP